MLLYSCNIVFQDVPGEVTLALNISQCPHRCHGCHSPHLWGNEGVELSVDTLEDIIEKYKDGITCVCFMGGDADKPSIRFMSKHIKQKYKLKVAWFSGFDATPSLMCYTVKYLDYVKFGPYRPKFDGLASRTTNQAMYMRSGGEWKNITYKYWKDNGEHLSENF